MNMAIVTTVLLIGLVLYLRGGTFHNYLVLETENIFKLAGFDTQQESPQRLSDGRLDFVDLLVQRGNCMICIEVETSARYALTNAAKADQIGLPLMVVCPSRKVQKAVQKKLARTQPTAGGQRICVLLLAQLEKEVMNCFPLLSSANSQRKNRKIKLL
jgi:hypothetical protein